ncbi:MAG TPA: YIP1 family protein [Blastocatellia bacterium]|nr:YIP1 family protein [Blastocatellia bacterium]
MSSQPPAYAAVDYQNTPSEPPKLGFGARLINVLFSPSETFADVNRAPKPVLPIIAVILLGITGGFLIQARLHLDAGAIMLQKVDESLARQGKTRDDMPQQQKDAIEAQAKFFTKYGWLTPFLAVFAPISLAFFALLFWVGNLVMQGKAQFPKVLSVVAWSTLVTGIIQLLLNFGGTFIRNPSDIDVTEGVIITNLSPLVPASNNIVLHILLQRFDLFTIWFLILCAIGLAAVSRKKTAGQMAVITFGWWALWVVVRVGWAAIFKS